MRVRSALLCLLFILGCFTSRSAFPIGPFSRQEQQRLDKGEIIINYWKIDGGIGTGYAAGMVEATPEQVFEVIAAVNKYREFTYRMVEGKIVNKQKKFYDFYYKIDMPWPLSDYWCTTRNVHVVDSANHYYQRKWTLLNGTFERNEGFWEVRPWQGNKALVIYSVILKPKTQVPQAVINHATKIALPRSVKNIRERVYQLHR